MLKAAYLLKVVDELKMDSCLIFVRTKLDADNLEAFLKSCGQSYSVGTKKFLQPEYSCAVLHSDRSVRERRKNLQEFKDGSIRFLICTDVAARGIDVKSLPFVINYTLPDKPEDYIHRVGRVGRADCMGLAVSLVAAQPERVWYHTCPSKGKKCVNRNLVSTGGCTIWYNEPQYFAEINHRVGLGVIRPYDPNIAANLYGRAVTATNGADAHVEELTPAVEYLAKLEQTIQRSFFRLKACLAQP